MIEEVIEIRFRCDLCNRARFVKTTRQGFYPALETVKGLLPTGWTCKLKTKTDADKVSGFAIFDTFCQFCSTNNKQ